MGYVKQMSERKGTSLFSVYNLGNFPKWNDKISHSKNLEEKADWLANFEIELRTAYRRLSRLAEELKQKQKPSKREKRQHLAYIFGRNLLSSILGEDNCPDINTVNKQDP